MNDQENPFLAQCTSPTCVVLEFLGKVSVDSLLFLVPKEPQ